MSAAGDAPPAAFPWADVIRACLVTLGWSPRTMWAATPREIAAALGRPSGGRPMLSRKRLEALMHRFPDGDTP
ncbi:phage tail assembly chaperone [Stappia stellulata]|uniref:phage tail assembly chaperone n=1 Tax=Stappia stellulata TaxID=71235 RepID=UPI0004919EC7|nr:phage tail assembly chaperone [Stappia stellulata]